MGIMRISNSKIKTLLAIQKKSKIRNEKKIFLIEGIKEIKMALNGGYIPEEAFICTELYNNNNILSFFKKKTFISRKIFTKLVYRDNSGGIIAIFKQKKFCSLEQIQLSQNPLILVIEKVEKPGNIGAIFRTADAASVDAVILDKKIDLYNPNIIRSSLGSIFTINIIKETFNNKIFRWFKNKNIKIIATCLKSYAKNIYKTDLSRSIALIIGTETIGLSKIWLKNAYKIVKIPMYGSIDSLNVSNATAIITFEAIRQRLYN
ncbi:MAG: RNA methyltransferase [Candidatus Bostrichicola ureolyticus]|nr:MAG: RNA methyltransferase [Candidatus Bostrichicola ureolyticus]